MGSEAKNIPLTDLGLPATLLKKLEPITDTKGLRSLRPIVLATEWRVTEAQWAKIDLALRSRGFGGLKPWEAPQTTRAVKASLKGKCRKEVHIVESTDDAGEPIGQKEPCGRPLLEGKRSCLWHWLMSEPIEKQTEWADQRRRRIEGDPLHTHRARVPEEQWPAGTRFCSECQTFVPLFYTRGSRCIPHASRAAHASMTKRVYDFTREDYEALLAWQKGRCYICQQVPRAKRLAVDHDHASGEVRGLLCANDEWGCNMTLRRLLNSPAMARRALEYVERSPLLRMQGGDPPVTIPLNAAAQRRRANAGGPIAVRQTPSDPFAGF